MTNQEAITKLTNIMHDDLYSWHPSILTAFSMAVDALKGAEGDCISRQAAIDALSQYPFEKVANCISIIEELPSAQQEQTDCIYCHEDSDGYVTPLEKNCHAFIRFGMNGWELSLKANGWHGSAKIRYCPMCGRDLLVK